nr:CheB methylesterase domain-containing protein [uncultured Bacillus sp.]
MKKIDNGEVQVVREGTINKTIFRDIDKNPSLREKSTAFFCFGSSTIEPSHSYQESRWSEISRKIILIGTSTGGPAALETVLTMLPKEITVPIVIVQHMPRGFTGSLATRLNSLAQITVKEAENGEILQNGKAYIAPGGKQLQIMALGDRLAFRLDHSSENSTHCPSVDVMLQSAASLDSYGKIVVIMTGMGSDGAKGLVLVKQKGNSVAIAESEESCIIYGMPKAAIATGLIDDIANIEEIAAAIMKYV